MSTSQESSSGDYSSTSYESSSCAPSDFTQEDMEVDTNSPDEEEQGYTSFPKDSIKALAKSSGYSDLDDNVAAVIVQDIDYKLTQLSQSASSFMRHCGREKLTITDVNQAMVCCDVPMVYGFCNVNSPTYISDNEGFSLEDTEVDLLELVNTVKEYSTAALPFVYFQWVKAPSLYELSKSKLSSFQTEEAPFSVTEETPISSTEETPALFTERLLTYYKLVTGAVLGDNCALLKIALRDLRSNRRIIGLFSDFVNFMCHGLRDVGYSVNQLKNLLRMMDCVLRNEYFNVLWGSFPSMLTEVLLHCIKKAFPESITLDSEQLELQEYAAHLLAKVIHKCSCDEIVYHQCIEDLNVIIVSNIKDHPLSTHLGAVSAVIRCGPSVICRVLYPHINSYVAYLSKILGDVSTTTAPKRDAAQRIFYRLLTASEIILRFYSEPMEFKSLDSEEDYVSKTTDNHTPSCGGQEENIVSNPETLFSELYKEFYNYFGDSLTARLPTVYIENVHFQNCISPLFPKQSHSGFELLDEINKQVIPPENNAAKSTTTVSNSFAYGRDTNTDFSTGSLHVSTITGTKIVLRRLQKNEKQPKKKKKAPKEKKGDTSSLASQLEKDSSSNSGEQQFFLSLTRNATSSMANKDLVRMKSKNSKTSVYRKLTTGNIDYIL